jgi:putative endonuclease
LVNKRKQGKQWEEVAEHYLTEKGYEIIERNFQKRCGEIDLIASDKKNNEIVFVEVKARKSSRFGYPEESVTPAKVKKIAATAYHWLAKNNMLDRLWRIDIIALETGKKELSISHLENITLDL